MPQFFIWMFLYIILNHIQRFITAAFNPKNQMLKVCQNNSGYIFIAGSQNLQHILDIVGHSGHGWQVFGAGNTQDQTIVRHQTCDLFHFFLIIDHLRLDDFSRLLNSFINLRLVGKYQTPNKNHQNQKDCHDRYPDQMFYLISECMSVILHIPSPIKPHWEKFQNTF